MTWKTLMPVLALGRANDAVLQVTARLVTELDAGVIGLAASRPVEVICRDYQIPAAVFEADRRQIARQAGDVERALKSALSGNAARIDWRMRMTILPLAELVAQESRGADLLIMGSRRSVAVRDETRDVDLADLVMQSGRPLLLVPETVPANICRRVLVAWKDTREARRAIADALPLLALAEQVTVVEIADAGAMVAAQNGVSDVVSWLAHHGVNAADRVFEADRANAAQLEGIARSLEVDLIVAGAWGYSRDREWVLGGITGDLLTDGRRCVLLSR
jgi:hypothetical protein